MKDIAEKKNIVAFSTPIEKYLIIYRNKGILLLNGIVEDIDLWHEESPERLTLSHDVQSKISRCPAKLIHEEHKDAEQSSKNFDALFDKWANEAVAIAQFVGEKPKKDRIPISVQMKVAKLWEIGFCYPGPKPACFRMADAKRGGPYNWFSYYPSNKTIYTNREYFVQVAAFHDLVLEYGYPESWLTFEYNESMPPVSLAIDIGIKLPDGQKVFVEVKERKEQWEALILAVKAIGREGVDLVKPDRGNDALRKAKYIAAGRPEFFIGYSAEGFDAYKVGYESGFRFKLEPSNLPKAHS
jgi:hypothetical protein